MENPMAINVTFWYEAKQEREDDSIKEAYPLGMAHAIESAFTGEEDIKIQTVTFYDKDYGLPDEVLDHTDVLIWWAHVLHDKVPDELVEKIQKRVLKGMGFIALHSAHLSKPFTRLLGTSCSLRWREGVRERLWTVMPSHPIARGLPDYIELPREEMYGEFFDIPQPDELVFLGWFNSGELFRSGCAFYRGYGRVFYFQPGHETNPTYYNKNIQKILVNSVRWAAPINRRETIECPNPDSLEPLK